MSNPLLLEGNVDNRDALIDKLEREVSGLREELAIAKAESARARGQSERAVGELKRQLNPLYQALRMVFGEIDTIVPGDTQNSAPGQPDRRAVVWDSWKKKLGGKQAEFIDALLEHGEMTGVQLKIATHSGQKTVYDTISRLNKLGLINKNGGRFSLKEL